MVCSRKKYNKTRISKKKSNLKGGMKADFDEWQKTNMGRVFIHFNLLNVENNDEISNITNINELDTNIIKTAISDLFESHLDTNNYSVELVPLKLFEPLSWVPLPLRPSFQPLSSSQPNDGSMELGQSWVPLPKPISPDKERKTKISNWDIEIHLQPENKEFPFLCNLTFVSELQLDFFDLDTVTKVITESESLPLELEINEKEYKFKLIAKYSNLNNITVNYRDFIKIQWKNEKEIECGFTNGLDSDPRSDFQCYRKLDCKKAKIPLEINHIKTKFKRDDIKCIPKYSKFNFDNEVIALENNKQTWQTKVDKLCLRKDYVSCKLGRNGCHWGKDDEGRNRCVVNPEHFNKRKDLKYY